MNQPRLIAIKLRKRGYSYGMIQKKLGIPKSTLSNWLTTIPFKPNRQVINRIGHARLKSALYKHRLKFEDIAKMKAVAAKDIGTLSNRDMFMLGLGLYIGEGSKAYEEIRIVNSDPEIIKLSIKWLKIFCGLDNQHFRITIHGYPDNDIDQLIKFWSRETKISLKQFGKTYIDTRKNKTLLRKRSLSYGTAHLYIKGGGTLTPGVRSLHRKIIGWIETATTQI